MVCFVVKWHSNACDLFWFGELNFVDAFFNTVCYRLENNRWGSRFPHLMRDLYNGKVEQKNINEFEKEVHTVEEELKKFKIQQVVYDLNDPTVEPPWHSSGISNELTNLSDYWVTNDGQKLFQNLYKAINSAKRTNQTLLLESNQFDMNR